MKPTLKTKIRDLFLSTSIGTKSHGGRILCFHDIQDKIAFEERVKWLQENFEIVSLTTILEQNRVDILQIAITFDDAYQSWMTNVVPVLEKHSVPATFFVNSGLVGLEGKDMQTYFKKNCRRTETYLSALSLSGIRYLANSPLFEIGGHTKDHFEFSKTITPSILEKQIIEDKLVLEQMIGKKIQFFAYPFGQLIHATSNVQQVVKKAGYKNAFTIVPGNIINQKNPWQISRDSLELYQSERVWKNWLFGAYDKWVERKLFFYKMIGRKFR